MRNCTIDQAVDSARQRHIHAVTGGRDSPQDRFQQCVEIVAERRADETLDDPIRNELYEIIDLNDLMPLITLLHRSMQGGDGSEYAAVELRTKYEAIREKLSDYYEAQDATHEAAEQMAVDIESDHTDIEYERCRDLQRERAMGAA
jgi:hypothetical protein